VELVALEVPDLELRDEGLAVTVRRSKTDQEGQGAKKGIPYGRATRTCPVTAVRRRLEASGVTEGPLFRAVDRHGRLGAGRLGDRAVALAVQRRAAAAGLDPARYAGHSLRAGLVTQAARGGASDRAIMDQTGHKSFVLVRRCIRDGSLFRDNGAAVL